MEQLRALWERVAESEALLAAVVIAAAFVAAKVVDWLVTRTLVAWSARTHTRIDDDLSARLHGPIVKTIMLVGLALAARLLLPAPEPGPAGAPPPLVARDVALAAIHTLVVLIWTAFALRASSILLRSASMQPDRFRHVERRTLPLFDNAAKIAIVGVAMWAVIKVWGIDPSAWLASAGVIGLALGFAAKDTLGNLFAGIFIIADAPYRIGDYVVLDSGERGMVSDIGLRSTRLVTRDDIEITIPNAVMGAAKITNETRGPSSKERLRVRVGVAYGSDVDTVRAVLLRCAAGEDLVCDDPEPRVRFRAFGESSLDFELLVWIADPVLRGRALDRLHTAIYKTFNAEGITFPFPQRDVHLHGWPVDSPDAAARGGPGADPPAVARRPPEGRAPEGGLPPAGA